MDASLAALPSSASFRVPARARSPAAAAACRWLSEVYALPGVAATCDLEVRATSGPRIGEWLGSGRVITKDYYSSGSGQLCGGRGG
jgi:hypothetical protein